MITNHYVRAIYQLYLSCQYNTPVI